MKKLFVLLYGITNYNLGSAALVCFIAFTFNLFIPFTIDSGEAGNVYLAAVINLGLIALFGLQHSVMARPAFKKRLARVLPQAAERSTFMLASAIVTFMLCLLWQPMPGIIWQAESTVVYNSLFSTGLAGWALVFYSTFLINHFDLFGLRQVWLHFRGQAYEHKRFSTPSLYRHIRHPLYVGWFLFFWATPTMTVARTTSRARISPALSRWPTRCSLPLPTTVGRR